MMKMRASFATLDNESGSMAEPEEITVKFNRIFPDELMTYFVKDLVVQHQDDHFVISFLEYYIPPIIADTQEERHRLREELKSIDSRCVARLVVTPKHMREFIDALETNYKNWEEATALSRATENSKGDS